MEEGMMIRRIQALEDVPELIHRIQSLLPLKEAARTSVLSESWRYAWNTNPTLRFFLSEILIGRENEYAAVVDRTLNTYHRNDIPIEHFYLRIDIKNQELASHAGNWIRSVATKRSLKEISIQAVVGIGSFTLPDELLAGERLEILHVATNRPEKKTEITSVRIGSNVGMIGCFYLRDLCLYRVYISEEMFDNLLCDCYYLEKIDVRYCEGLNTIKIKNLPFLSDLRIEAREQNVIFEADDVPILRLITDDSLTSLPSMRLPFETGPVHKLTKLSLYDVTVDDSFFDLIKSKFPFLEILKLRTECWRLSNFNITCLPLKWLFLYLSDNEPTEVRIHARKLLYFGYRSNKMPKLLFPIATPDRIEVMLEMESPINDSFIAKMRKTLETPSTVFDIDIIIRDFRLVVPVDIDLADLMRRKPFQNVNELRFEVYSDTGFLDWLSVFDALLSVCVPRYVHVYVGLQFENRNGWCEAIVRVLAEAMEKKTGRASHWPHEFLSQVELRNPVTKEWKRLKISRVMEAFLDGPVLTADGSSVEFKLTWCPSIRLI